MSIFTSRRRRRRRCGTEIDLLKRSSFAWIDLFGADDALMANGFNA